MVTLEQKIDLIMLYAVTTDPVESACLLERIREALSDSDATPESPTDMPSNSHDDLMRNFIEDLLKELGAPCHLIGYERVVYAIKLSISDPEYLHYITYRLYPDVAKAFDTSPSRVERSIRHLIEVAWTRHDIQDAYRIFGNTIDINRGKPTNSEFIAACATIVKRRMRDAK